MPTVLQSHFFFLLHPFFFLLHPPISTVRSKSQAFHFPQSTAPINLRTNLSVRRTVKCMANPRRVKMVSKQIMRELSDMLLTDTVLQHAVLPEAALGADRYLSSLTTISDVEVSNDLQVIAILDKLKAEKGSGDGGDEGGSEPSESQEDDQDWEVDDPEEDIIYVK